jgi:glycine betaine/proline transport system permease protein
MLNRPKIGDNGWQKDKYSLDAALIQQRFQRVGPVEVALLLLPASVMAAAIVALVLWRKSARMTIVATGCLAVAALSGLWAETMQTVALVTISAIIAAAIAFPPGTRATRRARIEATLRLSLDLMQTVPPWVYLIPAMLIFSLDKVPVMLATVIYGIPLILRITT